MCPHDFLRHQPDEIIDLFDIMISPTTTRWQFFSLENIMRVSRQADYATRTIYYLSNLEPQQRASTKAIATAQNIPLSFLTKIISRLSVAGLIHTTRGSQGGVSLTRNPKDISLLEVVEAIDGPILLNESVADPDDCKFSEVLPLRPVWCEVQSVLVSQLKNATFDKFGPDYS